VSAYLPHIRLFGADQVRARMLRGAARATNMKPANQKIADDMMRVIDATFKSQGRRYGGSWTHLDPDTIRAKRRRGLNPRILIARGRLMNAFTKRRSRNQVLVVTRDSVELGTTLPYAGTHQFGDDDRGIPARPFISFHERDVARWAKICEDELLRAMGYH